MKNLPWLIGCLIVIAILYRPHQATSATGVDSDVCVETLTLACPDWGGAHWSMATGSGQKPGWTHTAAGVNPLEGRTFLRPGDVVHAGDYAQVTDCQDNLWQLYDQAEIHLTNRGFRLRRGTVRVNNLMMAAEGTALPIDTEAGQVVVGYLGKAVLRAGDGEVAVDVVEGEVYTHERTYEAGEWFLLANR